MSVNEMKKISELPSELFNGVTNPYVPGPELQYSAKLKLHSDYEPDIDPITFEVIRHALWNINEEHGATIQLAPPIGENPLLGQAIREVVMLQLEQTPA